MSEPRYLSGDNYAHNGGYEELINCDDCGTEFDRTEYRSDTCATCEDRNIECKECGFYKWDTDSMPLNDCNTCGRIKI